MITVFTKDNCAPCAGTKKFLNDHNLEFTERNVMYDPTALEELQKLEITSVPVVFTDDDRWTGLNLQKLRNLTA